MPVASQQSEAPSTPRRAPEPVQRAARRIGDAANAVRGFGLRAVAGDRPLVAAVLAVSVVAVIMLSGPFQSFLDAKARVDVLASQAEALEDANAKLMQRAEDLRDPEHIELLAREQHNLIRPGEIPYVVVPPHVDRPQIADAVTAEPADQPWYQRLWATLTGVLR